MYNFFKAKFLQIKFEIYWLSSNKTVFEPESFICIQIPFCLNVFETQVILL